MSEFGDQLVVLSTCGAVGTEGVVRAYFADQGILVMENALADKGVEVRFESVAKLDHLKIVSGPKDKAEQLIANLAGNVEVDATYLSGGRRPSNSNMRKSYIAGQRPEGGSRTNSNYNASNNNNNNNNYRRRNSRDSGGSRSRSPRKPNGGNRNSGTARGNREKPELKKVEKLE